MGTCCWSSIITWRNLCCTSKVKLTHHLFKWQTQYTDDTRNGNGQLHTNYAMHWICTRQTALGMFSVYSTVRALYWQLTTMLALIDYNLEIIHMSSWNSFFWTSVWLFLKIRRMQASCLQLSFTWLVFMVRQQRDRSICAILTRVSGGSGCWGLSKRNNNGYMINNEH